MLDGRPEEKVAGSMHNNTAEKLWAYSGIVRPVICANCRSAVVQGAPRRAWRGTNRKHVCVDCWFVCNRARDYGIMTCR